MTITFTDYKPQSNQWVTYTEHHASIAAARVRAKVKGWTILKAVKK